VAEVLRTSAVGCIAVLWLIVAAAVPPAAQTPGGDSATPLPPDAIDPPAWPRSTTIYPSPDPFTLNGYDASQAIAVIRRAGLLIRRTGSEREIVAVDSVAAVRAGTIDSYPPAHRERWNLLLNGEPLDWDHLYIEYGGELLNLRLLFTYRNQRPVPDVPYRLP
tara:strand:+ start:1221 stop:1709 length:489 start_codon:yes stop_codon:yes gene_type:complete